MRARPAPFVVGSARSGTTLVRAMLDAHPDLAIPGESHFLPRLRALRARYERARHEGSPGCDVARLVTDLGRDRYYQAWKLDPDRAGRAIAIGRPRTIEDAIRALYMLYASDRGKTRWGDKTPAYVLQMPAIAEMFAEARFVHVIRDGRDVARSLLDLGWASSIEDAALRWSYRVRRGMALGRALGDLRYLEVGYEQLLADPEPTLRRICSFLDLGFDQAMTRPEARAGAVLATLTNPENHQRLHLPPVQVRDWRAEMTPHEVARFEAVGGALLGALGYERVTGTTPVRTRLAVSLRRTASLPARLGGRLRRTSWIG